jgi:hypothetical protein
MSRRQLPSLLALVAAALLALTAAFHFTGLGYVRRLAAQAGGDLETIAPLLWLAFSVDLLAIAAVAAVVALKPHAENWAILVFIALPPAAAAALQVRYIGFGLPTAILLLDAALLLVAAATMRTRRHG